MYLKPTGVVRTVGVTVGSEAAIESFVGNQVLKSADVRWDRLRVQPAESGVRLRVKLVDLDAELSQYTGEITLPGTEEWVDAHFKTASGDGLTHFETSGGNGITVYEPLEGGYVVGHEIDCGVRRTLPWDVFRKRLFDACGERGRCRSTVCHLGVQ